MKRTQQVLHITAHHDFVLNRFRLASKLIESQPTAYEGLYAACVGPIQDIDVEHDLPLDQRSRFVRWCNRILPDAGRPCAVSDLMASLRQLSPIEAEDLALELSWFAKQMAARR